MLPVPTESLADPLAAAAGLVRRGKRFLVSAHARVDGDALGAMLVTAHGLRRLGKEAVLYNHDAVPQRLRFLPGAAEVSRKLPRGLSFDAALVHDTGARHLLGDRFPGPEVTGPLIVLDHHAVTTPYGDVTVCDPAAASSGVMAFRLLRALGLSEAAMGPQVATALFTSLVEDSGWFHYGSTNAEALRLAAACVEAGAAPAELALALEESATPAGLRLLALVLGTLELRAGGRLAVLTLTDDLLRQAGATPDDVPKLVNYARGLRGVEVGVLLTYGDKDIYASLRSKGGVNVAAVAERFGGGGHVNAAGCALPSGKDEAGRAAARERLLSALEGALA